MLERVIKLFCKYQLSVVPLISVPCREFAGWTRDNFPDVINISFKRDGCDIIVEGLDVNAKSFFSLRHSRKAPILSNHYMNMLRNDNGIQRIHKSELRSEFADWIQENYPSTRYVYIHPQENIITDECGVAIFISI